MRGAIVGPHGSGKSTLLEHLVPRLGQIVLRRAAYEESSDERNVYGSDGQAGEPAKPLKIVWLKLRGQRPSIALVGETSSQWNQPERLLVVDGYEQLPLLSRLRLVQRTARGGVGLLLTSHRATWLPTLTRTVADVRLARTLLEQLIPQEQPNRVDLLDETKLQQLLNAHRGNLREVFMDLYDQI